MLKRKEVITMTYVKPELVELVRAASAIQNINNTADGVKGSTQLEGNLLRDDGSGSSTTAAYQADE
jgi:hypothetical protein